MKNTTNDWFWFKIKSSKRFRKYRFIKMFILYNLYNLKSIILTGKSLDELHDENFKL